MSQLETILKEIEALPDHDKAELVEILLHQAIPDNGTDEAAVGQRGLDAWTESTRSENWAEFYPDELGGRGGRLA